MPRTMPSRISLATITTALLLAGGMASAQTVYRIVGPDGRVTFSDRPPPAADAKAAAAPVARPPGKGGSPALPYALQQVVNRFPVTLYSGADCAPCGSARNLLVTRGVPFTERTVNSNEDIGALQRLSGDTSLPFATIGGQQLKGFSDIEWTQFLDAAGYPKTSELPAGFRPAAPTPLVAVRTPPAAADTDTAPAGAPTTTAPATTPQTPAPAGTVPAARTPANPAGITF